MKDLIKEALDEMKKERLFKMIFQELNDKLIPHPVETLSTYLQENYPKHVFFEWQGKEDYYVMEYDKRRKVVIYSWPFWESFFENFSIGEKELIPIIEAWLKKTFKYKVEARFTSKGQNHWWRIGF
jgi:hypothetical protein